MLPAGMTADVGYWTVTAYMVMAGLGMGPSLPLFTLAIQNAVDVRRLGQATSAGQFFRQMGGTVAGHPDVPGSVVVELDEFLAADVLAPGQEVLARRLAAEVSKRGDAVAQRVREDVRQAFVRATRRIYSLAIGIMVLALALAFRIPELPLRRTHDRTTIAG